MNSAEKEAVLHCLKSMIDEEVCEECPLYGTTGTDHCEKDCVRLAINALSRSEKSNKWIPVSERYPEEEGEDYLVCYDDGTIRIRNLYFTVVDNEPYFEYGQGIVAWMPLPTPYKASPTDEEVEG